MKKVPVFPVFAAALLLMFFFPAAPGLPGIDAARAQGLVNVGPVLKAYIEGRYHWSNVRITGLVFDKGQPGSMPGSISVTKEPPGKTVFALGFPGGRTETATATVTGYETVVKTTRLLRINSVIGPEDVSAAAVDVSRLPEGGFFKKASQAVGKVLTCSVGAGVTILDTMVSKAPLVNRGHRVTIMVDTPEFRITAPGQLVESARVGGYAKVMNLSSRKMLPGVLVDENTVLIREDRGAMEKTDAGDTGRYQAAR